MEGLPRLKLVFLLEQLRALFEVVVFLIAVQADHVAQILLWPSSTIVKGGINVYSIKTYSRGTTCSMI